MDDSEEKGSENSRRTFLKGISAAPLTALAAGWNLAGTSAALPAVAGRSPSAEKMPSSNSKKFVAIQIGARSFVDEGVDKCLDTLQEKGAVNVLLATVFTYGRGLTGQQVPEQPLPDHGVQEYDEVQGGSYNKL